VLNVALLLGSAVAIYLACELFVNAVEHLGRLLRVGTLAIGTVLAAVGTALPESLVTGVAVTLGDEDEIGVGAALGGPLVLATVAYGVVGVVLLVTRQRMPRVDTSRLARDQALFLAVFALEVALGVTAFAWKPWLGLLFFAGYAAYVVRELRSTSHDADELEVEPLRLSRSDDPGLGPVLVQSLGALAVVFAASQLFVSQLSWAGGALGLRPAVVALLLAPVATELPEVMSAVIWVRQGKAQLALANISGSMMVQVTVPSGLGLLFTSWELRGPLLLSVLVTAAAIGQLWWAARRKRLTPAALLVAGGGYAVFAFLLAFG